MSATATQPRQRINAAVLKKIVLSSDLAELSADERMAYYESVCEAAGLNPLTKPFDFLMGRDHKTGRRRLMLHPNKDCAEQLRKKNDVSVTIISSEHVMNLFVLKVKATMPDGRFDESVAAVATEREEGAWDFTPDGEPFFKGNGNFVPLRGFDLANAMMACETNAKRRATLSICGVGFLDSSGLAPVDTTSEPARAPTAVAQPAPDYESRLKKLSVVLEECAMLSGTTLEQEREGLWSFLRFGDNVGVEILTAHEWDRALEVANAKLGKLRAKGLAPDT